MLKTTTRAPSCEMATDSLLVYTIIALVVGYIAS